MARNELQARLKSIIELTPSVKELTITPASPFDYQAGQFVMLLVPGDSKPAMRAYSIASPALQNNEFKLVIKHFEGGVASEWVRKLKGGEDLKFTGPFGKFLFKEPAASQVIMACTSTGAAPLYSMLATHGLKAPQTQFKFLMGVWNESEVFYQKELDALKAKHNGFNFDYVLDSPTSNWSGFKGRVTDPISKLDLSIPTEFYLCGNPNMIKSVKDLLAEKQFPKDKIYTESYG